MIDPAHDIPGRLRFAVPAIRRNRRKAELLRARVRVIAGVRAVAANPLTGSLIVHHDDRPETRRRITGALSELNPAHPDPEQTSPADSLTAMLANAIAERLIEHAVKAAVAAVI